MNKEIKRFLKEGRERGFSYDNLRQHLLKSGYPENSVNEEINLMNNSSKKNQENKKAQKPIGVKIVTNIHYFVIPLLIILFSVLESLSQQSELGGLTSVFPEASFSSFEFIAIAMIFPLIISIIPIVVGRNISKGKNGDRIFAIILGFLFLFLNIFSVTKSIYSVFWVLVSIVVIWFLLLDKKTVAWFKKKKNS